MPRSLLILFLSVALLAGCVPGSAPAAPTAAVLPAGPTGAATAALRASPIPAAVATAAGSTPALPAVTAAPTADSPVAPAQAITPPAVTPQAPSTPAATGQDWAEWDTYLRAVRPAARQGIDLRGMTQYHIALDLAADLRSLNGSEHVYYTNRSQDALGEVYLHLFPNLWHAGMTVSGVQAAGQPATTALESGDSLLRVSLPQPLAPGAAVELSLSFAIPIPDNQDVGNYGEFAYLDGVLAVAHFYPTVAVYDNKGWHRETPAPQGDVIFHQASLYDVLVTAPADLKVAATGALITRTDLGNGRASWRYAGGPMRDFNLVASRQYEEATQQVGDVKVYSHFVPAHAAGGRQALAWAAKALELYQKDFGPYPYNELHVTETSTSAGGIEYPGLVVVAASLYDNPARGDFFESATVHEVAHQWFYNVVGNDQINDPWLDEASAQYCTYLYYEAAHGASGAQGFKQSLDGRWQRVNYEDKPIGLPVADYEGAEYSAIVYGRGPLFLIALQDKIGQATMLKFYQEYYRKYAWAIARPADFQGLLQQVAGQDLSEMFNTWVYPKP